MASNGLYAEAMSPTATDRFPPSPLLSTSISSLSPAVSSRHHSSGIIKIYRQASTLFLTRRLPEALSTVLPLITPASADTDGLHEPAPVATASRSTRVKVWSLHLTILNAIVELGPEEGKEAFGAKDWRAICSKVREGEIWEEVVRDGYHGAEGQVDSEVVINLATLLLSHARTQTLNQKRLENYLATSSMPTADLFNKFSSSSSSRHSSRHRSPAKGTSGANTPRDLNARVKILELYTLHVLLRNNEWDYARDFISVSPILDEERRSAFLQALQSLQEEHQLAEQQEREEKQRQEERLRQEIEDSRRLRAENQEREARRLEEACRSRGGSEVDYGVEEKPGVLPSNASGRPARTQSSLDKTPGASRTTPQVRKGKVAAPPPPSLAARAEMVMINLRIFIESLQMSFRANPTMLLRTIAFILSLVLVFSRRSIRERISRIMATGFGKLKSTAGMGVKVSYL